MDEHIIISEFKRTNSISKTAQTLDISYRQVNKVLVKNEIKGIQKKRKKIKFNLDYFKVIDTQDKAYFLGFIHADGSVFTTKQGKITFALAIHKKDREILEKLLHVLDLPISFIENVSDKDQVVFRTSVQEFVANLLDVKSFKVLQRIPDHLLHHFIRGIFDGDGTIYSKQAKSKYKYYYAGFIGFTPFLEFIKDCIPNIDFNIRLTSSSGISRMEIYSKDNLLSFYEFLYKDATIYLTRKHAKFMDMKFIYSTSTTTREAPQVGDDIV